jgi:lariat debranching enzyme
MLEQFMDIPTGGPSTGPPRLQFDPEWLAISRAMHPFLPLASSAPLPNPSQIETALTEARTWIKENIIDTPYDVQTLENGVTLQPLDIEQVQTFCFTAAPHDAPAEAQQPNQWYTNMQTEAFATFIGVENKVNPLPPGAAAEAL